jgi:hypothetical protein
VFSGVFIAEEVEGAGDKVSGDTTMVDVQTVLEAFFDYVSRSTCFIDGSFLVKNKTSGLETTTLKCQIIRISE